jgi:branched-subunit amino acid ABC-type transport system permease component
MLISSRTRGSSDRTRLGKTIRATAFNPNMVAALGINTGYLYGLVFAASWAGRAAAVLLTLSHRIGTCLPNIGALRGGNPNSLES